MASASSESRHRPDAEPPAALPGQLLGPVIRRARRGRFTVAQLSARSGVSANLIGLIEHGKGNPSVNTLAAIAEGLDVSLAALIDAAVNPPVDGEALVAPTEPAIPATGPADAGPADTGGHDQEDGDDAWISSILLHRGQDLRLRVLEGSLELHLRDRSAPEATPGGGEARLAVEVQVGPHPVRVLRAAGAPGARVVDPPRLQQGPLPGDQLAWSRP
jgi:transcriptional regulator with XRE-family HTH domain